MMTDVQQRNAAKHFAEFWKNKIETNATRDQKNYELLREQKWNVIVIWECELKPSNFEKTMSGVVNSLMQD